MEIEITKALLDKIDQYLKGELKGEALISFEQALEKNPALKEEVLIQKRLFSAIGKINLDTDSSTDELDNEILDKVRSQEHLVLSNKIKKIGQEYIESPDASKKPFKTRLRQLIPALAAVFLLVIISTVYLVNDNQSIDHYYHDYANWDTELVSFAEKGDSKNEFVKAEAFFKAKEYNKAVDAFEEIEMGDPLYPYSLMYMGASYANLNQNQKALEAFNNLSQMTEFAESSKGLWYSVLIHLKQKDKEKAVEVLNNIVKDEENYHFEDAKEILEELK